DDDNIVNSTELFDPSTESWTITGNMTQGRYLHTASLLKSGKVLVSGGGSFTSEFSTDAELYDFSTGVWTNTSSMNYQRASHTATVLADGNVLVIGENLSSVIFLVRVFGRENHNVTVEVAGRQLRDKERLLVVEFYEFILGTGLIQSNDLILRF
ncbi:unnamed protein product, partial [Adineta steineri]